VIRWIPQREAQAFVLAHHSHHNRRAYTGDVFRLGLIEHGDLLAVVVAARPGAPTLDGGETWDVARLCVGPKAPRFAASRLLGAIGRVGEAAGCTLLVSYTRVDEPGTCYLASGWTPIAVSRGREHTTGNRSQRHLPGLYEPSAEIVDLVRWERGERAGLMGAVWLGPSAGWVPL
jgi:hypothetical protein